MKTFKIQKFGQLIVLDQNLIITGISDEICFLLGYNATDLLGTTAENLLQNLFHNKYQKVSNVIHEVATKNSPRCLITAEINGTSQYLKISNVNSLIYIEIEKQYKKSISTSDLNDIAFLFESKYFNNWKYVCKAVNKIIQFDRVFVLQVQDTGLSNVIAENNNGKTELFDNKQFSKEYMPNELIKHYNNSPYRYSCDMEDEGQNFTSLIDEIDLSPSQLILLPEFKVRYLTYFGIKSAIFFPLYLNGKFWGLFIGHNSSKKVVDLQNRKICTFIVQNAMSKYEGYVKQGLININLQVQEFQNNLLERLSFHKTINCALVESMESLRIMLKSDGIGIYNEGEIYFKGDTPSSDLFYDIIHYIQSKKTETIFIDHNFKKNHKQNFDQELPFAGILSYNVDKNKDYYVVWFRKENITIETQLEFSNSTNYEIKSCNKTIYESSIPWNDEELSHLEGLQSTLNHSMLQKLIENKNLTKNLLELNNELEFFTYTISHDLKNPLSIVKVGIDFLKNKSENLDEIQKIQWYNTVSSGIQNIEDIIDNIIHLSKERVNDITKETVQLKFLLRKIVEEIRLIYTDKPCKITFGNILPIWGQKSAVYQIFTNIISNAVKYTQGCKEPSIHINSFIDEEKVCYTVQDNGIGIPEKEMEHIYGMFVRATNVTEFSGSGIGLSLAKRIMDRLGGELEIKSKEGIGTTVIMRFPIGNDLPKSFLDKVTN